MPWYKIPNKLPMSIRVKGGKRVYRRPLRNIKPKLEIKPMRFSRGSKPPLQTPAPTYLMKGVNLATEVGVGNFQTRNFRQKPLVMLQTATHTPNPNRVFKAQKIPKNILLPTITTMPTTYRKAYPPKKVYKTQQQATNSKNGPVKVTKKAFIPKVIKKELTDIKKSINVDKATHTYKSAETGKVLSLIGRCNHSNFNVINKSVLEAMSANLRYYNPSVPGTLTTADANTGTFSRDVFFKSIYSKIMLRNNYQVPCRVKVYLCKVKTDNNDANGPLTLYTTAIADQVINASVDETDALIHINDIERVKDVWSIDCVIDKTLEPGQEATANHDEKSINFDPAHIDDYTNAYQKSFKAFNWLIRVEGVLGHDTSVATEQTLLLAGIDYQVTRKAVIEYDAGVQLNDIYISETRQQAFTNGGVCSLKPIADNIPYSVA